MHLKKLDFLSNLHKPAGYLLQIRLSSKFSIYFIDIFIKIGKIVLVSYILYYIGGIEMKFSNRLLLFLAVSCFVFLGLLHLQTCS